MHQTILASRIPMVVMFALAHTVVFAQHEHHDQEPATNSGAPNQSANVTAARPRPSPPAMGDFAPKLAEITDNVLYADIWERPDLSKRDRSLATVAALIALNRPDQLRSHLRIAR